MVRHVLQVGVALAVATLITASACQSSGGTGAPRDANALGGTGGGSGGSGGGVAGAGGSTDGGGGAGQGGTAGGTGGSAGSSTGAGGDPCATALFCDDFESYTIGQVPTAPWTKSTNQGTVAVDGSQFHSGAKSVKFTTQSSSSGKTAFIRLANGAGKTIFPAPGNNLFGRLMFRLESAPTASVHWTLVEGSGLIPGKNYHALYRYGGQVPVMQGGTFVGSQLMANYETPDSYGGNGPSSDCWFQANKVVAPVGAWTCVEWQFDGPNNTMRLWLNGTAVPSLTVPGVGQGCVNQPASYPWTAPTFDRLDIGWESYQADDARTVYIDDLVVSTTKVGCPL